MTRSSCPHLLWRRWSLLRPPSPPEAPPRRPRSLQEREAGSLRPESRVWAATGTRRSSWRRGGGPSPGPGWAPGPAQSWTSGPAAPHSPSWTWTVSAAAAPAAATPRVWPLWTSTPRTRPPGSWPPSWRRARWRPGSQPLRSLRSSGQRWDLRQPCLSGKYILTIQSIAVSV